MKVFKNLFKKRINAKDQKLIDMYEEGKFLRVDEDVDNKKIMKEGDGKQHRSE